LEYKIQIESIGREKRGRITGETMGETVGESIGKKWKSDGGGMPVQMRGKGGKGVAKR
jgi:hypothetical protein